MRGKAENRFVERFADTLGQNIVVLIVFILAAENGNNFFRFQLQKFAVVSKEAFDIGERGQFHPGIILQSRQVFFPDFDLVFNFIKSKPFFQAGLFQNFTNSTHEIAVLNEMI